MAGAGAGEEGKKAAAGSSLHSKTLLKSEPLYQYILESTVFPREPDCLRELRLATAAHPMAGMAASPDEVQLLGLLIEMLGAKNAIEVGVFTGYSLLATAVALPDDGKIVAIDVSRENYDQIGSPVIEKAGMAHKIDFRLGLALPVLDQLLAEEGNNGRFDFAFVDADKVNFLNYHERLLQLVRVGGLIAYDNTLWGGSVAMPRDTPGSSEFDRVVRDAMIEFNAAVAADDRIEPCLLPIADGVTLCRRVNGFMASPPDEGLLLKVMGARNTIEVGVFNGCSVLATALALPDDGRVVSIDVSRENFDPGWPVIHKAGVAHKVDFREGPALPILAKLLADEGNEGKFDFAFVDADKGSYGSYHDQLLRLVRVGGVLTHDNTLFGGSMAMPEATALTERDREIRGVMRAFNAKIAADPCIEAVQLPVADGITLCRRVV